MNAKQCINAEYMGVVINTMMANANLISCNCSSYPSVLLRNQKLKPFLKTQNRLLNVRISPKISSNFSVFIEPHKFRTQFGTKGVLQICQSSLNSQNQEDPVPENGGSVETKVVDGEGRDWTTSILLFVLWGGLMYYVFNLAPNQTPLRDTYFLKKLLNLKGDDGFKMNEVLVSLWYIMGLWPLVYSMLLLPTGRSSKSKIPVWPFLVLSCFGGAYLLLPYFVLWTPPPPPVEETELESWPLKIMDSKLTAGISFAAGLGIIGYAALASGDVWKEFYQYFQESKFIHATCLDFALLSSFAPFWVYNDMTARKWYDKGSWLLPLALVPLLGPALYLVLRPSLSELPVSSIPSEQEK